ncbi:hypothetical protein BK144_08325 [Paenibacillus sp. FSL R7-0273]|nr:hypothetical protein BK144_08325 [Paenibacillus sp. FSL R7-0273]
MVLGCLVLIIAIFTAFCWQGLRNLFTAGEYGTVDEMAESVMLKTATPGAAALITRQGKTEFRVYGYADTEQQKQVTEATLFELGSTTKAFTALAVILLEQEGRLAYSDHVTEYLPWFGPAFRGNKAEITISQLLAHTSGIPAWSIGFIPEGTAPELLEDTVHKISDIALDTYPGTGYQYATVNYDILALIIEQITGMSYQNYVGQNILMPLGMTDSYFATGQEKEPEQLSKGYRVFFGKSIAYDAPRYYGNIAAGYLVTNVKDLERWVHAQLDIGNIPDALRKAIRQSHEASPETAGVEAEGRYYSYGWSHEPDHQMIRHTGSNPNYSSHVIIDLEQQTAVFVLANLNSAAPSLIASNIYENINGNAMKAYKYDDTYTLVDVVFSFLVLLAVISVTLKGIRLAGGSRGDIRNERSRRRKRITAGFALSFRLLLLVLIVIWPYLIQYNYYMISVWMSSAVFIWMGLAAVSCVLSVISQCIKIAGFTK